MICSYVSAAALSVYGWLQSDGRVRADVSQKSLLTGPYTLIHLLVVALLAFFLGHFL